MQPNEQTFCHVGNDSMKQVIFLSLYLIFILPGCKRENTYQDCMPNVNTIDTLYNLPGTIVMIDSPAIYAIRIAEQMGNSFYTPCNLPASFQILYLQVTVSGLVKYTLDPGFFPNSPQPFVITQIANRN